jgi:hypothetical protein
MLLPAMLLLAMPGPGPAAAARSEARQGSPERRLPNLERILAFAEPRTCRPGEPLRRLFEGLSRWNGERMRNEPGRPFRIEGLERPVEPRLVPAADGYWRAFAPIRGRWHGLTVTAVQTYFRPETDIGWDEILFADPPERVLQVLDALGFGLDPSLHSAEADSGLPDREARVSISLYPRGRGSALSCTDIY